MSHAVEVVRHAALAFEPVADGLDALIEAVGQARLVLIGEATHGTHEFYHTRAELTKTLIAEHGFAFVAVEADWPDAYRVNRWVRGASEEPRPEAALDDFRRFPRWMWRNKDVVAFIDWLHQHNASRPVEERVGFYGLDLYSLHRSMEAVLSYLRKVDPDAAKRAKARYDCFEMYGEDPQAYGYASTLGLSSACEDEVTSQLLELRQRALDYANRDGRIAADEFFFAEQNARLVANAETYYRAMFGGRSESWNLRDQHMMETLEALLGHLAQTRSAVSEHERVAPITRSERTRIEGARGVVWAHNSHLGDARATQMGAGGELNLGQLVRERYASDAWLIGFATHTGTVTAARNWDDPAERRAVRPAMAGSYERLFHEVGLDRFLLLLRNGPARDALWNERLERAIGVIYRPETERHSHYFRARLPAQFDAVLHFDVTSALEPLEKWSYDEADLPETYPSGI